MKALGFQGVRVKGCKPGNGRLNPPTLAMEGPGLKKPHTLDTLPRFGV